MRSFVFSIQSVLLLAGFFAASHAQQLLWEGEELQFNPSPADKTVVGHFKFKNIGQVDLRITSVTSSCSCTTVDLPKKSIAPNESGEIAATFTVGARTGNQEKTIMVDSNDRKRPVTVLLMKVAIPEVAQLRPSFLFWSQAEPLTPKEISFKIMNGFPVKTIAVESSNQKITAKVEPMKPGQEYRIVVTPSETDQQIMAILSIKMDYPPENPKTFYANVRVVPKK